MDKIEYFTIFCNPKFKCHQETKNRFLRDKYPKEKERDREGGNGGSALKIE
jgi:hypothetical protein